MRATTYTVASFLGNVERSFGDELGALRETLQIQSLLHRSGILVKFTPAYKCNCLVGSHHTVKIVEFLE